MKKIIAVLGTVAVLLSLGSVHTSPAGADVVPRVSTTGVTVSGTLTVGSTLTAKPGDWSPQPDKRTYEWLRDGEDGVLGTGPTYAVVPADVGHTVVVVERIAVGAQRDDTSFATARIAAGSGPQPAPGSAASPTVAVTVSGSARVGAALRATLGAVPGGVSTTVQWLRDGSAIPGANATTYTLAKDDGGRTITARATAVAGGAAPATSDSNAVRVGAFVTKRPAIRGTAKVGKRLSVRSKGTWYAAGHAYRYEWLRNGKRIAGATKSSYKLSSKDRGKRISVRVSARKAGFPTVVVASAGSKRVK